MQKKKENKKGNFLFPLVAITYSDISAFFLKLKVFDEFCGQLRLFIFVPALLPQHLLEDKI